MYFVSTASDVKCQHSTVVSVLLLLFTNKQIVTGFMYHLIIIMLLFQNTVRKCEQVETSKKDRPLVPVEIYDSGTLPLTKPYLVATSDAVNDELEGYIGVITNLSDDEFEDEMEDDEEEENQDL